MSAIKSYIDLKTDAVSLAMFRMLFGLMMLVSIFRFWSKGWIKALYIEPTYFFSFHGFEWIKPMGEWTYLIFSICGLSALGIAVGYRYRISAITFFLSFTYIELMDKTTYLNHYYFVSLVAFMMIWLPADVYGSVDAYLHPDKRYQFIPRWSVDVIKLMLGIVYFYAGLAKLNSDWLIYAQPLKIWLPSKFDTPIIGRIMTMPWTPIVMSWSGAIYDLLVPFLLLNRRTRLFAFLAVIGFHVMTRMLFPIGMFPYIMIVSTLIFFDARLHHKIVSVLIAWLKVSKGIFDNGRDIMTSGFARYSRKALIGFILFFGLQMLIPFRYLLYPGELFWTEEGFRFSWRVMLIEKAGMTNFRVVDNETGQQVYVKNEDHLTPFQVKQMSFQADFILEFAHYLKNYYQTKHNWSNVSVYADSHVTLNSRLSRRYIDPTIDLAAQNQFFQHKTWILPFNDEIKGL